MDGEEESGASHQGQNLHDLQNYLVTFNKEIESGDDVLSGMDVDEGVGDVGDLYNSSNGTSLQEPGEGGDAAQFSSGFYSEQGILDSTLSDAQQMQNLVANTSEDTDDVDMTVSIKQEVRSMELEDVQAQISGFGDAQLTQAIPDIQASNTMSEGLIMTSLNDSLDPSAGKVIRIVSLGEGGQFLSLGDGQRMQILSHDDLGIGSDCLTTSDNVLDMQGAEPTCVVSESTDALLQARSISSSRSISRSLVMGGAFNQIMVTAAGTNGNSNSNNSTSLIDPSGAQLVALQGAGDSAQAQLVSLAQGSALTADSLQMSGLLSAETMSSELGYQTVTILPPELNQGADMNYILIMANPNGDKDGGGPAMAQVLDMKQEAQEFSEELLEVNGEMKRVLRVVPKKYMSMGPQLMCDYCSYTSSKRYLLTRHMKSHSEERPHKCTECDRGFKTQASLLNHINTHTGTRPHKCKTCEAAFTTSGELVRHIRYRHTFEKPHRCPNCDYASVELSKLKRHMRSHTGERPYKCPQCSYASPDTYKLKRHLRIHTGEKPYECDICHARFTQSNSLKAHKLIHTGNKPVFQCNLCPTTCGRKTDLKIHINKLHTVGSPLECKKCGKVFSDRYSYKQHVRSHDIERCFRCDHCDFIANTERGLDQHGAIHANGKRYQCDVCRCAFNLEKMLEKHKLSCQLDGGAGSMSPSSTSIVNEKDDDEESGVTGSYVYKSLTGRIQGISTKGEGSSSGDELPSSLSVATPSASGTLHRNLLQDIKAGKLGAVPQVVIVHPDGSLEEISSKLPGSKLNLDDILSTLSSTERSEPTTGQPSLGLESNGSEEVTGEENTSEKGYNSNGTDHVASVGHEDEDTCSNEEDNGESSQCEASTQAELESDTDSVDDGCSLDSSSQRITHENELLRTTESNKISTESKSSTLEVSNVNMECILPEKSVFIDSAVNFTTTSDPNILSSLIRTVSTSLPPSSSSSSSSSSSCPPSLTASEATPAQSVSSLSLTASVQSSSAISEPGSSSGPHYAVIKGYTYMGEDSTQPTFVNLAVDRDSVMKLFMTLGSAGEGTLQLLAGDLDPSAALQGQGSEMSVFPTVQLGDLGGISGLSSVLVSEQGEATLTAEKLESDSALDMLEHQQPCLSDIASAKLLGHDGEQQLQENKDLVGDEDSEMEEGVSEEDHVIVLPSAHWNRASTEASKSDIGVIETLSSKPVVSMKTSASSECLHSVATSSPTDMLLESQTTRTSLTGSIHNSPLTTSSSQHSSCLSTTTVNLGDLGTNYVPESDRIPLNKDNTKVSSFLRDSSPKIEISDLPLLGMNNSSKKDSGAVETPSKIEFVASGSERSKAQNKRKRSVADPSLMMTGKRVRKALVKVSL